MRRLLVNDLLTCIPGTRTFWHDLQDWFEMEFVGGDYATLADHDAFESYEVRSLIIRNASWFGPIHAPGLPVISLLQDIFEDGPQREMQNKVMLSSWRTVFNSEFTRSEYDTGPIGSENRTVIPLPVDFRLFEPGNAMGLQQALALPDDCVCWVGASEGAAGEIKGYDIFLSIVRQNPDIHFVGVFKDKAPEYTPPNLRAFVRLTHEELVKVMGACRVGLCTSRSETQHLAGIEMGACGLPMVAPPVGVYWRRDDMPGLVVPEATVENFSGAVRGVLKNPGDPQQTREYWKKEFSRAVIKAAWTKLVEEVEGAKGKAV